MKVLTPLLLVLLVVSGCAATAAEAPVDVVEADLKTTPLVVSPTLGTTVTKRLSVSGTTREPMPSPTSFQCGSAPYYGSPSSNVASVEVKNTSAKSLGVTLSLEGGTTAPTMFVYSPNVGVRYDCRSFSQTRELAIVVEPNSAVRVMIAAGGATGTYTLKATTDVAAAPTPAKLKIAPAEGGNVVANVFVTGARRENVPSTTSFQCGTSPYYGSPTSNAERMTIENPSDQVASLTLRLAGVPQSSPQMFVYASKALSATYDCLAFSATRELTGDQSVVIEPRSAVDVLVATGSSIGAYELTATTDALFEP